MRFTIRDLMWATVVVSVALGWWIDVRRRDAAITAADMRASEEEAKADMLRAGQREWRQKYAELLKDHRKLRSIQEATERKYLEPIADSPISN